MHYFFLTSWKYDDHFSMENILFKENKNSSCKFNQNIDHVKFFFGWFDKLWFGLLMVFFWSKSLNMERIQILRVILFNVFNLSKQCDMWKD